MVAARVRRRWLISVSIVALSAARGADGQGGYRAARQLALRGLHHGLRYPFIVPILALSLAGAPVANAAIIYRGTWRLEGYVGQAPAETKPEAHITLQYNRTNYEFDLMKATVISGHVAPGQFLRDIASHQNKVLLRGSRRMMAGLTTASYGEKVFIFGHHDTGSRDLHVTLIRAPSPNSTPAAE